MAMAVPTERKISSIFRLIVPPETLSTCSLKTQTAGSAQTIIAPRASPVPIRSTYQKPPSLTALAPNACPRAAPACEKPPFTPIKKIVKPKKAYIKPITIRVTWRAVIFKRKIWKITNMAKSGAMESSDSWKTVPISRPKEPNTWAKKPPEIAVAMLASLADSIAAAWNAPLSFNTRA